MSLGNITELQREIVLDIEQSGPDCAKFISRRLNLPLAEVMEVLGQLERLGWLKRVKGTFLMKKGLRRPKHMNHTYFELSREAKLLLRELRRKNRDL